MPVENAMTTPYLVAATTLLLGSIGRRLSAGSAAAGSVVSGDEEPFFGAAPRKDQGREKDNSEKLQNGATGFLLPRVIHTCHSMARRGSIAVAPKEVRRWVGGL